MAIDTSPKSMSTGQGFTHLWQTVQWSADVRELVEVLERDAAPGLLFVEEGLDQQRRWPRILLRGE